MGNWTREGVIGQMFKTFAKFIAPSGMPPPVLWGDEAVVRERLGHGEWLRVAHALKQPQTPRLVPLVGPTRPSEQ
jgi:hypothetical protein